MGGAATGQQIKKWFMVLIIIIFVLDASGMVSLFLLRTSMVKITKRAQPLIEVTEATNSSILEAQIVLYKYLSGYQDSPADAAQHLEIIGQQTDRGLTLTKNEALKQALQKITSQAKQYELVVKSLPSASEGAMDWQELDELTGKARDVGEATRQLSSQVKAQAKTDINLTIANATQVATIATFLFLGFLAVSLIIVVTMLYWWRKFQEMILDL